LATVRLQGFTAQKIGFIAKGLAIICSVSLIGTASRLPRATLSSSSGNLHKNLGKKVLVNYMLRFGFEPWALGARDQRPYHSASKNHCPGDEKKKPVSPFSTTLLLSHLYVIHDSL
jgi:hypothetical protein